MFSKSSGLLKCVARGALQRTLSSKPGFLREAEHSWVPPGPKNPLGGYGEETSNRDAPGTNCAAKTGSVMHLLSPRHLFSSTFPLLPLISPRAEAAVPVLCVGRVQTLPGPVSQRRPEAGKGTKHILQILTLPKAKIDTPAPNKKFRFFKIFMHGEIEGGKARDQELAGPYGSILC